MKIFTGKVISKKMPLTATVAAESVLVHKLYGKIYKKSKKYHVHDTLGVEVGDLVKFVSSKPYSKLKRWKIISVIGKKSDIIRSKPAVKDNKTLPRNRKNTDK
jgi:small subunit ribosomal protein S17